MAKFSIEGTDSLEVQLNKLLNLDAGKEIVWAGAQPVADEMRINLKKNIEKSKVSQGDLIKSLGIAPPSISDKGVINTKIGFHGYDKKGVPNALKARVMESGSSKQKKRPFIRPAVIKTHDKSIEAMQQKYNELLETER